MKERNARRLAAYYAAEGRQVSVNETAESGWIVTLLDTGETITRDADAIIVEGRAV